MSAAAVPTAPAAERPDTIAVIRDDGPVATALGRALGPSVPLPAAALAALGSLPLLALIAFGGGDVAVPFAGAAILWAVVCGGVAAGRPRRGRLRWTAT
ncbi:MAG: hypothetical protein ACRDPC_25815, partial [Solirubrobacteraceae bacterium]